MNEEKDLEDDEVRDSEGGKRGEEALRVERVISGFYDREEKEDGNGEEMQEDLESGGERSGVGVGQDGVMNGSVMKGCHFAVTT